MRFLMVTHFFESHGGGIERVAGHLCKALADAGHEVCWAASDADPAPGNCRIETLPLACFNPTERLTGLPMPVPAPRELTKLSRAVSAADVVIVHDALYVTSLMAAWSAWRQGKPFILIQHIAGIPFASSVMRRVMSLANALVTVPMLRAADQVIFISDTVRGEFAHIPLRRSPQLIFNGVDAEIFRPGNRVRPLFDLPESGKVAAFVGRFVEKKGLSVLREAALLRPDVIFALAGTGPIDPTAWGAANVRVLGRLSRERVADLFRSVDLLLLPSIGEGYPLVIQEAMACGLPVVCGEESARADPAVASWLHNVPINLRNPALTAGHVSDAIDSITPEAVSQMQMAAYAESTYKWSNMAAKVVRAARLLTTGCRS